MKTPLRRGSALLTSLSTALLLVGCGRFVEEDAAGKKHVRDGAVAELRQTGRDLREASREAKENLRVAGREIKQAGEGLRDAGREVGAAGRKVGKALEPIAKEVLGDAGISARVKAKLLADPEVAGMDIDVDTVDGKVTLSGKAANRELRAEAEKLAKRTPGVRSVENRIEIVPQAKR